MSISDLPSGELQFVDDELDETFAELSDGEEVDVLIRPVCSRTEFLDTVIATGFGSEAEAIGFESIRICLTEGECNKLIEEAVVEAIELNRPIRLIE